MRILLQGLGFGLIVLLSGVLGAVIGMRLGPVALQAGEVSIGCGVLGVALAGLAWHQVSQRAEGRARRHALMSVVEQRMARLSHSTVRAR